MRCIYCRAELDHATVSLSVYENTCLDCTGKLMAPMTDNVIQRRLEIECEAHGQAIADRLLEAILKARE